MFWWLAFELVFEGIDLITLMFMVEGVIFLLLPIISLSGSLLGKQWPLYTLVVFPFLAFIHAVPAVPFAVKIFPSGLATTLALIAVNMGFVCALMWLKLVRYKNA